MRVSYAKHPALPNLADKVERCMDVRSQAIYPVRVLSRPLSLFLTDCLRFQEKFLPFSKHKGSQITNWFQQVCEKEALAFEN